MEPSFSRYSFGFYPHFGFSRMPYRNRYRQNIHNDRIENFHIEPEPKPNESNKKNSRFFDDSKGPIFELFGIELFFDDVLLISLIFFLYNEGVHDQYLFIALILLLLS